MRKNNVFTVLALIESAKHAVADQLFGDYRADSLTRAHESSR